MRTCIVTRDKRPKRELIRILRTPDGNVCCDPSGRADGRGAYVTLDTKSVQTALSTGELGRRLRVTIDDEKAVELISQGERECVRRTQLDERFN